MSKELEALETLKYLKYGFMEEVDISIIEKQLKALEIIKKKKVNTLLVIDVKDYNEYCRYMAGCFNYETLTQEEFDLLKEVLL